MYTKLLIVYILKIQIFMIILKIPANLLKTTIFWQSAYEEVNYQKFN